MSIEAMRKALNYIENTEGELGIKLSCGDALREALAGLFVLDAEKYDAFISALDNPPPAGPALKALMKRRPAQPTAAPVNPVCDLQALLEIRDFLADIVGGAEVTERSRDTATGFVSIMDVQFGKQWADGGDVSFQRIHGAPPQSCSAATDDALATLVLEYARDLRRNSSGGDDYPWEYAKGTADYLEELVRRANLATRRDEIAAGAFYKTRGDKNNLPHIVGPLEHADDGDAPWQARVYDQTWKWGYDGLANADGSPHNRDLIERVYHPAIVPNEPQESPKTTDVLLEVAEPLARALRRCQTVLSNMAAENEGPGVFFFNRWPINHEPLRADARNLAPIVSQALSAYHAAFMKIERETSSSLTRPQRGPDVPTEPQGARK